MMLTRKDFDSVVALFPDVRQKVVESAAELHEKRQAKFREQLDRESAQVLCQYEQNMCITMSMWMVTLCVGGRGQHTAGRCSVRDVARDTVPTYLPRTCSLAREI